MGRNNPSLLPIAAIVAAVGLVSPPVWSEEMQTGRLYRGGTRLESGEIGAAFIVPPGWQGGLPAGSDVFVLQPESKAEAYILALEEEGTRSQLAAKMESPIPLDDGLTLYPLGEVTERGRALAGRYEVRGARMPLAAYGEVLSGPRGVAVAYVLIATPDSIPAFEAAVHALSDSTELAGAPAAPAAHPRAGRSLDTQTPSGSGDRWDAYLRGKYLVRYHTRSGFTDERHLWLCSDGTFLRRGASGGFGGGASGAAQSDSNGSWTAQGAGEKGRLELRFGNGEVARHDLRWDYGESKLYLDDQRWLHGENAHCD